jgi:lipopolysaccharide export system permease protein
LKIFRKSLSRELIHTAAAAFLILVGIVIAQRSGYLVQIAAKGWIPNDAIATILGFNIIRFLPLILSLTIFLSVLLTLMRWHRDSEMAIWFSSGLAVKQWVRPILNFAVPVVILISILSFIVMPWATKRVEDYRVQLKSRDELSSISPGVFKESNNGNRIYFVESFDNLGHLVKNVFVQSTQQQKIGIMVASSGKHEKAANKDNFLVMEKGRRYQSKANSAEVSSTEFERYALRIETKEVAREPDTTNAKSTKELILNPDLASKAELQWRLAIPISALILVLLAIPLSFIDPRAGTSLNLILAIFIFAIYNNMLSIFQAWISQGRISTVTGLWPVHVFFVIFCFYLFYRRTYLLPILPKFFQYFTPSYWLNAKE